MSSDHLLFFPGNGWPNCGPDLVGKYVKDYYSGFGIEVTKVCLHFDPPLDQDIIDNTDESVVKYIFSNAQIQGYKVFFKTEADLTAARLIED